MRSESKPVDILLQNDDTEEWPMRIAVEDATDESVFQTTTMIPPDTGEDLGEIQIDDAFTGRSGDQFTVRVWLADEPAGTFDYEITCDEENYVSLLVEYQPYSPDDGEPVDYVPNRCGE